MIVFFSFLKLDCVMGEKRTVS